MASLCRASTVIQRDCWCPVTSELFAISADVQLILGHITPDGRGSGLVEADIPKQELDYYASRLLSVGTDVVVRSPPELVEAIRNKAGEVAELYR